MNWGELVEQLVDAVNVALEAGEWAEVVQLTAELYAAALRLGDGAFAELVQDLHWIANDALLHPLDVQYLTPHDFCNGLGHPLSPVVQRHLFRAYVQAAIATVVEARTGRPRRGGLPSADIALVRSDGFVRRFGLWKQDYVYGRPDLEPYEPRALAPVRPYGVPIASEHVRCCWLDGPVLGDEDDNGDESWIDEYPAFAMASQ